MKNFSQSIIHWQTYQGRHNLPWQCDDPYKIWLSEIMLQQTQVTTVKDYFVRFIHQFPSVWHLATSSEDKVLEYWAGLGYYARARNLHKASKVIIQNGFPTSRAGWETLSGVGRSTAAAICVFAYGQKEAILDGNVKRILCRHFAIEGYSSHFMKLLWEQAEKLLPDTADDLKSYTQGLMDLGATVCVKHPQCTECPLQNTCLAHNMQREKDFPQKVKALEIKNIDLFWLIIIDENQNIYLQKRPSKGIWGGLWTCPQFENSESMQKFCFENQIDLIRQEKNFVHRLTHRLLTITPYIGRQKNERLPSDLLKIPLEEALNKAIPRPLQQFLKKMYLF